MSTLKKFFFAHPIEIVLASVNMLIAAGFAIFFHGNAENGLPVGDFFAFLFLAFLVALHRPGWVFLFLIGSLPFETIRIAPSAFPWAIHPYQGLAVVLAAALVIRKMTGRFDQKLFCWNLFDTGILALWAASIPSALFGSPADIVGNIKQSIVLLSFAALYFLSRIFLRTKEDIRIAAVFFAGSGAIVGAYAILQNILFLQGKNSFEVMAGRPNAFFSEPDWLGFFLIVGIAALFSLIFSRFAQRDEMSGKTFPFFWLGLFGYAFTVLILSLARSAWVAAFLMFATACFLMIAKRLWRRALWFAGSVGLAAVASLAIVIGLRLTPFALLDRAQSTASGLQTITVACETEVFFDRPVETVDDLQEYGCRHISLEERDEQKAAGMIVLEAQRYDPNISTRRDIYRKSVALIAEHPFFGTGFSGIQTALGNDERGAGLNASNVFLEVWLGSGIIGLTVFVFLWFSLLRFFARAMQIAFLNSSENEATFHFLPIIVFLLLSWIGITVFNLFNAGLLLGFVWVWMAIGSVFSGKKFLLQKTGE